MIPPTKANHHQSHAGRPSSGTHFRTVPTNFAISTPIIAPLGAPMNVVKQPTPKVRARARSCSSDGPRNVSVTSYLPCPGPPT